MSKIYTKEGDKGQTTLNGGLRVDKDDPRIVANGSLDELNSVLGLVRSFLPENHEWQKILYRIQSELINIMSQVAMISEMRRESANKLSEDMVSFCETNIDILLEGIGGPGAFILPGGTIISAHLHFARTVARRAERLLWTLNKIDELPPEILQFMNRLSDLLFVMARAEMFLQNYSEEQWKEYRYNRS